MNQYESMYAGLVAVAYATLLWVAYLAIRAHLDADIPVEETRRLVMEYYFNSA